MYTTQNALHEDGVGKSNKANSLIIIIIIIIMQRLKDLGAR